MRTNLQDERELLSKPGDTITETLEFLKMSQAELAERMGRTAPKVNDIISGKEPITNSTALQLEKVLGIEASFWLNREMQYREKLSRLDEEESLLAHLDWVFQQPVRELKSLGYIKTDKKGAGIVRELLQFFGVASPAQWESLYVLQHACTRYRKSQHDTTVLSSMAAWLRIGELEVRKLELPTFEKEKFKDSLTEIRALVANHPDDFRSQLQQICSKTGVAVVYSSCLRGAPISGAARWIGGNPVIQLTDRHKSNDRFWFTFFHEAGHILLHGKKHVFLEEFEGYAADERLETEANRFASRWLLPDTFIHHLPDSISEDDIMTIAIQYSTHPAIVVGRLQHEGILPFQFGNHLKVKVDFGKNRD